MAVSKKEENRVSARVYASICAVVAVVLVAMGCAMWKAGTSVVAMVNEGLVEQKIYFPPEGSPAFSAEMFPEVQKHAGKQVTDGAMAKVYAEDFVGKQLELAGGGKTLSEVSAAAMADPTNPTLQQLQQAMFQGETSKGLLLGNGYGAWAQGMMLKNMGVAAFVAAGVLGLLAVGQFMRYKKLQ